MVALNFRAQFAPMVESGAKTQTIRSFRKRPFQVGDSLQLYTGQRTRQCRKLVDPDPVCVEVWAIELYSRGVILSRLHEGRLEAHSQPLRSPFCIELALADGFPTAGAFFKFFEAQYGLPFAGQLIMWGNPMRFQEDQLLPQDSQTLWETSAAVQPAFSNR